MERLLTAEDSVYRKFFDVTNEAESHGAAALPDFNGLLSALRARGPVQRGSLHHHLGQPSPFDIPRPEYVALSFNACERAFRENLTFTSYAYNESRGVPHLGSILLNKIGEEHRNYRATAQALFFKTAALRWWRPKWIDHTIKTLLDRLASMDGADLNLEFCARIPVNIVSQAVGLSDDDALVFREHLLTSIGGHGGAPADQQAARKETDRMLRELVGQRRKVPRDDLISYLIASDYESPQGSRKMTDEEVIGFSRHLLLAGGGTTWRQLGIAIYALLSHRHFWDACLANRELIDDAVDEATRWNATGPVFPRLVIEETELEGIVLPAGARIDLCLGAANRDPARWENPDEFDLFRRRRAHLGFGYGPHLCLGQHVARQMMVVAIRGLMNRFPNMRIDAAAPPPRLTGGVQQRGYSAIPVLLR